MNKSKYALIKDAITPLEINEDVSIELPAAKTNKQKADLKKLLMLYRKTVNDVSVRTGRKFRTKTTETHLLIQRVPIIELPAFSQ